MTDNPHRHVLEGLQSGTISWCQGSFVRFFDYDGTLKTRYCALGAYGKALLNVSDQELGDSDIVFRIHRLPQGERILHELRIFMEEHAVAKLPQEVLDTLREHHRLDDPDAIIRINDYDGYTREDLELAVEKAAIAWDERVE